MTAMFKLAPQYRVYAAFALHALTMGSIFPRMPEIMAAMAVSEGTLGLSLIGVPVGTLLALTFATPILERIGFRRALLAIIPLSALFYAIAVQSVAPLQFFVLLIPAGLMVGCAEIIINVEADRTEALISRRIMIRAHSFWSIGFFLAGLIGAVLAQMHVSPQVHLAIIVPIVIAGVVVFLSGYAPAPARAMIAKKSPVFARPTFPIMVLVMVTLSALLMEGAGIDWSAIYMDSVFDSDPFIAGFAVAVVAFSQAVTRFFADGYVEKMSPERVCRVLLVCLGLGILTVMLSRSPVLSLIGFAMIGIGTSVIFPLAISAAAQRTDRSAAVNVAALAQLSFVAFLLGPPLLGFVAEHFGIRWAFGAGLPFVVLSLLTVRSLGTTTQADLDRRLCASD